MHKSTAPTLGELLMALRRRLAERGHSSSLRDELSLAQFEVLWFVSGSATASMDAIAEHLSIKPPSATALISALERRGCIKRTRDPNDRRVVNVALTPAAKRQLTAMKKRKDQAFESLLTKLSSADRKEFTRILTLLTEE